MAATFTIEGSEEFQRLVRGLEDRAPMMMAGPLYREAERIMADAKQRTPVDTGALRESGHVTEPVVVKGGVSIEFGFGNSSVGYAVIVHEDLDAHHPVGEAKYLENAITTARRGLAARLAADLRNEIAKAAGRR